MLILRIILFPVSLLYGLVLGFRNWFFNMGILSITKVDAKVIAVGNLSTGGTGKTPHVDFLLDALCNKHKTAVLLRGYGRKSKGFQLVDEQSTIEQVGDEALNYKNRFQNTIKVAVCEKRVEGAQKLLQKYPELELIILDDAFQHRYIYRDCNILLTEYNRPFYKDFVLPTGRLREFSMGKNRADIVIVTKTPTVIKEKDKKQFIQRLGLKSGAPVFFSSIEYGACVDINTSTSKSLASNLLLVTGIGNPTPLLNHLKKRANVKHLQFADHHHYTKKDIENIHKLFDNFARTEKVIVTTEKDAMRLNDSNVKSLVNSYPWCYQKIKVKIEDSEQLLKNIDGYFSSN